MTTYWDVTEEDVYIRVFNQIFDELDTKFFDEAILNSYIDLHVESRYLVTRLFYRSRKWVSKSDLGKYLPPEKLDSRIEELIEKKWLVVPETPEDVVNAANLKELIELGTHFGVKSNKKGEICSSLLSKCSVKAFFGQTPLSVRLLEWFKKSFAYYKISKYVEELDKAMFLYLLPSYGSTSDVVVRSKMNLVKFISYEYYFQKDRPLFKSKDGFDSFYTARTTILDPLEEATSVNESILAAIKLYPISGSGRLSSAHVIGRATHLAARILGKMGSFELEYQWTRDYLTQTTHKNKRSENWVRLLLLELKFFSQQADTVWLRRALNTYFDASCEMDEISVLDLHKKAQRLVQLLKKHNIDGPELVIPQRIAIPVREEVALLNAPNGTRTSWGTNNSTVEEAALEIYALEGWKGGHFENGVMSTLFAFIFHDILFSHKESFLNSVQSGPMSTQRALDECKHQVQKQLEGDFVEQLTTVYNRYNQEQPVISGVNWEIPLECLVAVAQHPAIRTILRNLTQHYRISGFMDLTLWNNTTCKFVEVKSTNDVVSDTQYIWMKTLLEVGMDVEICKIRDSAGNKKRKRI